MAIEGSARETPEAVAPDIRPTTALYSNELGKVYRLHRDGASILCKQLLGPDAMVRAGRERDILARLAGIEGISQLAAIEHTPDVIAVQDAGGIPLALLQQRRQLSLPAALRIALDLARIAGAIHARGVLHLDINPGNILLAGADGAVLLTNFHLARSVAEFAKEAGSGQQGQQGLQGQLSGTLAYMPPELADGSGRAVDHRADLYALGATLYALATGRPPFVQEDVLQLVHEQLTRTPPAPGTLAPIPAMLSELIMRLLEKEPDQRYQSAAGVAYDLAQIAAGLDNAMAPGFVLGRRDFPSRLRAPQRLIGRDTERNAILAAFQTAASGPARTVLLSGAAGAGKGKLVAQLRQAVHEQGGMFVTGKFDQQRQDRQSDGVYRALRELGRLLLAQHEGELARMRADILGALGVNANLMANVSPEFALLLGIAAEELPASPDMPVRMLTAATDLLRAIASPRRPLVIAIDEMQWAHQLSLRLLHLWIAATDLRGVLLVVAWRDTALAADHPLAQYLPQWEALGASRIALRNLALPDVAALLEQMLRMSAQQAGALAAELQRHTGGNPYDTVALVNALRQREVLRATDDGWTWDSAVVRRHVGSGSLFDLLEARIDSMPAATRRLIEVMACLGGEVPLALLESAADLAPGTASALLAPALDDGLMASAGGPRGALAVRFVHERVQEVVYAALDNGSRQDLHLAIARRLDALPDAAALAAAQYLPVAITLDGQERQRAITLFRKEAHALRVSNGAESDRLLGTALLLLGEPADDTGRQLQTILRCQRHAALVGLGRDDDADAVYALIDASGAPALEMVPACTLQIARLTLRSRPADALALGRRMLARLGQDLITLDTVEQIDAELAAFEHWVDQAARGDPHAHPVLRDARLRGVAMVLERCAAPAFLTDYRLMARIALTGWRLCAEHGVCAPLVVPLSYVGMVSIRQRSDYSLGYAVSRFLLELSQACGYRLEGARVRAMFVVTYAHWFDPIEESVAHARLAHATLMQGGDWLAACLPLMAAVSATLECAPTLADSVAETGAALVVAARAGNTVAAPYLVHVALLAQYLQSEDGVAVEPDRTAYTPIALSSWHVMRAMQGALMGQLDVLDADSAAACALKNTLYGVYNGALVALLRAVALAQRAQQRAGQDTAALLAEAAVHRDELARRATDAPGNFGHVLSWLDAELAWAQDAFRAAAQLFDDALDALAGRQRPWHRALITERAGLFYLAHGMREAGRRLLNEARKHYHDWGASAKVRQLERAYPFLQEVYPDLATELERHGSVSVGSLHMMAVLRASQALSSETSLDKLHTRVAEQLGAMTGASKVLMLLPGDEQRWHLVGAGDQHAPHLPVDAAAAAGLLPLSAFRYVERTRTALVVEDMARDDRFAADPYCRRMKQCSLLLLPIMNQGVLRAMLILENDQRRGAFAADRLAAVELVAGQLAVSLDNAMLYASLERKVAERTQALELANRELAALSLTDALTGLANRRRFDDVLAAEWIRCLRPRGRIGAAMIDVDQFKLYNDLYGHQQGDGCLRMVADALANSVRHGVDLVARYGGEEFAIILPGADLAETRLVAERARAAVAALLAPHLPSLHGVVTVSVGITSQIVEADASPEALFRDADAALYLAKQQGRNRVVASADTL